ncbi:MAG: hypothetical protein AAF662_10390 [Pseudomonadota bacterium]
MSDKTTTVVSKNVLMPNNWPAAVAVSVTAVCFTLLAAIVFVFPNPNVLVSVEKFLGARYSSSGELESHETMHQIQFWTPSNDTYADVPFTEIPKQRHWQKIGSDSSRVDEFEEWLEQHSNGWRRFPVHGSGRTGPKDGYWWTVTTTDDFVLREFIDDLSTFWGNKSSIYVEQPLTTPVYMPRVTSSLENE